ncbi:MAG: prepilin-type N-terminal cleavage/methylation domain-containing protein [Candidatus Omnitrophica bacterium]|nr:prepilin-type N-terminal cleavage/methylation domain-containing protein [Candidatus Omnitrophota bacterium]MCM8799884.1 prepilin-type N-terminal cleavage/methylation domain-containing protein [Candidatus Omnitrophota bacterium]
MQKDNFKEKKGFTLIEILIICIIVGILISLSLPLFEKTRERALDKEASATLKLIQSAERVYQMEVGIFIGCTDEACINNNLRLSLPKGENRSWSYSISTIGVDKFIAEATRNRAPSGWERTWSIDQDDEEPTCNPSSVCP